MASGYTVDVASGQVTSAEQYILRCARAMGALAHMRDEPFDAPIKRPESRDYYAEKIKDTQKEVDRIEALTDAQIEALVHDAYMKELEYHERQMEERNRLKANYEQMKAKVERWTPPTREHYNLKEFAIKQLDDAIAFDCDTTYLRTPARGTSEGFKDVLLGKAQRELAYYVEQQAQEQKHLKSRNDWINDLLVSLEAFDEQS